MALGIVNLFLQAFECDARVVPKFLPEQADAVEIAQLLEPARLVELGRAESSEQFRLVHGVRFLVEARLQVCKLLLLRRQFAGHSARNHKYARRRDDRSDPGRHAATFSQSSVSRLCCAPSLATPDPYLCSGPYPKTSDRPQARVSAGSGYRSKARE